jgi:hypothetical protein
MKPGALVFLTTQAKWFLDYCRELREEPARQLSAWHEALAGSFPDYDACAASYDRGELLYAPNGGGPELHPDFYGDAIVPVQYFERNWGDNFELLEFITDRPRFEQAVCIMRRR